MNVLTRAVVCGLLLGGGLAASTYQINFTGTINSGTAQDFNLTANALQTVADLTGLQVSGWMDFNLGAAPLPVVSVDGSGFTNTVIQSTGGPVFVSEHFVISGFAAPGSGFLPMPSAFDLAPVPSLPGGTTVTQTQDGQALQFSTKPVTGPQSVITGMNFQEAWTGPVAGGGDIVALDLLITSGINGPHFFPVPTTGDLPASWGPVNIGGNGVFNLSLLSQNHTIPDHFGITSDYSVMGGFTLDSASGGFLPTPEPGTLALAAAALALAATRVRTPVRR